MPPVRCLSSRVLEHTSNARTWDRPQELRYVLEPRECIIACLHHLCANILRSVLDFCNTKDLPVCLRCFVVTFGYHGPYLDDKLMPKTCSAYFMKVSFGEKRSYQGVLHVFGCMFSFLAIPSRG